jgi:hypothetical protein
VGQNAGREDDMKQYERKIIALCDDAAVLCECSNTEGAKIPRLTIHNGQYSDDRVVHPATSAVVFGQSVRDLYDMLHEYYTPPPVQSDQSPDTDPHENDESRAGIRPFERNAERRAVDGIL